METGESLKDLGYLGILPKEKKKLLDALKGRSIQNTIKESVKHISELYDIDFRDQVLNPIKEGATRAREFDIGFVLGFQLLVRTIRIRHNSKESADLPVIKCIDFERIKARLITLGFLESQGIASIQDEIRECDPEFFDAMQELLENSPESKSLDTANRSFILGALAANIYFNPNASKYFEYTEVLSEKIANAMNTHLQKKEGRTKVKWFDVSREMVGSMWRETINLRILFPVSTRKGVFQRMITLEMIFEDGEGKNADNCTHYELGYMTTGVVLKDGTVIKPGDEDFPKEESYTMMRTASGREISEIPASSIKGILGRICSK